MMNTNHEHEPKEQVPKDFYRTCAVVLARTPSGVFLPLLLNKKRHDWELPGGGRERDHIGEAQEKRAWYDHGRLLPDDYDGPGDIVPEELIRQRSQMIEEAIAQRKAFWDEQEMKRELKEELHLEKPPASLLPLGDFQKTFFMRSGGGRNLAIHSSAFVAEYVLPDLPAFSPAGEPPEHDAVVWLRWQGWDDLRNYRTAFTHLQRECAARQLSIWSEEGSAPVYAFQEMTDASVQPETLHLSEITAWTLGEYINQSFNTPPDQE